MDTGIFYSDRSWQELKEAAGNGTILVLPVGSTEQHGPALPVCTDDFMALRWAEDSVRIAVEEHGVKALVMPGIHYGYAAHHMVFPGTITLSFETLKNLVYEVCDSVLRHGFRKMVILNVHGGNRNSVRAAATDLAMVYARRDPVVRIRVVEDCDPDINPLTLDRERLLPHSSEAARSGMVHSGALETAKILYLRPGTVDMSKLQGVDVPAEGAGGELFPYDVLTPLGAMGKPGEATGVAGKIMWEALVGHFVDCLRRMNGES